MRGTHSRTRLDNNRHDRPGRCRWHSPVFLWCVDKNSKVYGFSVLAIIGRWQDRRRPLACYAAACGGLQLRTFASMDMSFITPQIVLVVLVTLVLLVAALVLVTLSLRSAWGGISAYGVRGFRDLHGSD